MKYFLLLLFLLIGCGSKHPAASVPTPNPELVSRYQLYKDLVPRGWPSNFHCDALLFVSLTETGLGEPGLIEQASKEPGHWFRLPSQVENPGICDSDISRDMFMGLFFWIWRNHRLDLAEDIWTYGEQHNWKMGEERGTTPDNRTILAPQQIGLLAVLIHALGGPYRGEQEIPTIYSTDPGFISHLSLLNILLLGEIHGSISEYQMDTLNKISQHMTKNPLVYYLVHKYSDGDQSEATRLLLSIWPDSRLPSYRDWNTEWRLERSDSEPGFLPGTSNEPHTGGDFLFVASLILEYK